jgi:phytol kinase
MMLNAAIAVAALLALTAGLMTALRVFQRRWSPHPEWSRKLMHVGTGLLALSLPWLFRSPWPVLVLCATGATGMAVIRQAARLKETLGCVVGGVARQSAGDITFPLGIAVVFLLSQGDCLLYSVPVLVLTFADAAAALVGTFYGLFRFETPGGKKTIEGSLAFFVVAFLSIHIPLFLCYDAGQEKAVLIAFLLGFLLTIVEALAGWRGLDNLLIPVAGFIFLRSMVDAPVAELVVQGMVLLSLAAGLALLRRQATLSTSALLGAVLVGYMSWTLGGWKGILASLLLFMNNVRRHRGRDPVGYPGVDHGPCAFDQ